MIINISIINRRRKLYTAFPIKIKELLIAVTTLFILFALNPTNIAHAQKNFPEYAVIKDNISFWENIYANQSESEAVIHDSNDISFTYKKIHLLDPTLPGASIINKKIYKNFLKATRLTLTKLATKKVPKTKNEIRIFKHYSGNSKKLLAAANSVRVQTGIKDRFQEGVRKSGQVMGQIKAIFRKHKLPEELAYLPHVESSFINSAHSFVGAKGIWQFTKATGKDYLTISPLIDERLDPILATEAAAKYLKRSYDLLGSWPLAITSYNYGRSGMRRAQIELGSYPAIFSKYDTGAFKFASKNFYPEFLAALKVAKRLERDPKIKLDAEQKSYYFTTRGYINIASISRHFKVPGRKLASLNPALKESIISNQKLIPKGYRFRLPRTNFIRKKLKSIHKLSYKKHQKKDSFHIVKKNQTVSEIAAKHGTTVKILQKINQLDQNYTVRYGQKLNLPLH